MHKSVPMESLADISRRRSLDPADDLVPRVAQGAGKLHTHLAAVVDRLKNKQAMPAREEAQFVRNGEAEVQIWLTDTSEETLAELKKLGVEVLALPKSAKLVLARVPIEKLEAVAAVTAVRYVAPHIATS